MSPRTRVSCFYSSYRLRVLTGHIDMHAAAGVTCLADYPDHKYDKSTNQDNFDMTFAIFGLCCSLRMP